MTTAFHRRTCQTESGCLKDFQRETVDVIFERLFRNGQQRMLVADEVGLGKTIVAKGVIARRIQDKIESGDSNAAESDRTSARIRSSPRERRQARHLPRQRSHDRFASRLTYLAFEPEGGDQGILRLNTLTPATSFNSGSSTGQQGERRILYSLLIQDEQLSGHGKALSAMLRASVQKQRATGFRELDAERDNPCGWPLRPCCHSRSSRRSGRSG